MESLTDTDDKFLANKAAFINIKKARFFKTTFYGLDKPEREQKT